MAFIRTQVSLSLLNDLLKTASVSVDVLGEDGFVPTNDRAELYAAAIEALIQQAKAEGFDVRDGGMEEIGAVYVFDAQERCPDCNGTETECTCWHSAV